MNMNKPKKMKRKIQCDEEIAYKKTKKYTTLPDDSIFDILSFLDNKNVLLSCAMVCKQWMNVCKNNYPKNVTLYKSHMNSFIDCIKNKSSGEYWKNIENIEVYACNNKYINEMLSKSKKLKTLTYATNECKNCMCYPPEERTDCVDLNGIKLELLSINYNCGVNSVVNGHNIKELVYISRKNTKQILHSCSSIRKLSYQHYAQENGKVSVSKQNEKICR